MKRKKGNGKCTEISLGTTEESNTKRKWWGRNRRKWQGLCKSINKEGLKREFGEDRGRERGPSADSSSVYRSENRRGGLKRQRCEETQSRWTSCQNGKQDMLRRSRQKRNLRKLKCLCSKPDARKRVKTTSAASSSRGVRFHGAHKRK